MTDQTAEEDQAPWYGVVPEVLSGLNIGLVVARSERAVVVNDAFCALTGYSAAEILDVQGVMDIVMPGVRDLTAEQSRRRRHGGEGPAQYETEIAHRDGRPIPVEVSAEAVGGGAGTVVATVRDLTDQKRIEVDLAARARQQETVAELGRQTLVDRDVASLMATAVTGAAVILGVEYIEVQELQPDHRLARRAATSSLPRMPSHQPRSCTRRRVPSRGTGRRRPEGSGSGLRCPPGRRSWSPVRKPTAWGAATAC